MRSNITVKTHDKNRFSVNGYPADCVNVALHGKIIPKPDVVISGINHGPNLGDDVYYSGTVAGARVAHINDIFGIAVSLNSNTYTVSRFIEIARFVEKTTCEMQSFMKNALFLNINYPDCDPDKINGTAYTSLGRRRYIDEYHLITESENEKTIKLEGSINSEDKPGTDGYMVNKNYISITPLSLDSTDYHVLQRFQS